MTDSLLSRLRALRWEPSLDAIQKRLANLSAELGSDFTGPVWQEVEKNALAFAYAVDADRLKAEVLRAVAEECDDRSRHETKCALTFWELEGDLLKVADALAPAMEERT